MSNHRAARLAVVIPVHNRETMIGRALGSVLACSFPDIEVIVVDDASTDGTAARVRAITDPRLRYHRLTEKSNGNVARNAGIALCTAPLIAFLDSDDVFQPGRIERLLALFARRPEIDAVADDFFVVNRSERRLAGVAARDATGAALQHMLVCHTVPLTCSSIAVRRRALDAVGGFDAGLPRQQDRDLLLRLSRAHRVAFGTGSDVIKHQNATSLSRNPAGYVAALDQLVARHAVFCELRYREILSYLALRGIFKAVLSARLRVAFAEARQLRRARHLPRTIVRGFLPSTRGRRLRHQPFSRFFDAGRGTGRPPLAITPQD
ncbi:glycosyltransferase family 2 protein [Pseudohoeflea coraliihabitans]|uniref:Glycosyltransferase n=1 Tax=Pseudohoeflea coraliihabitans TaxID=2860393 RepID=A0ABS6WTP5_9HYPH|nr:glycosyltransferase family 2 protein [Pseudohoeflea sp. DP4N28-3]MBW3099003.1 glycosyltransferase [Pseudohoeflea sp. DP4N28-3]